METSDLHLELDLWTQRLKHCRSNFELLWSLDTVGLLRLLRVQRYLKTISIDHIDWTPNDVGWSYRISQGCLLVASCQIPLIPPLRVTICSDCSGFKIIEEVFRMLWSWNSDLTHTFGWSFLMAVCYYHHVLKGFVLMYTFTSFDWVLASHHVRGPRLQALKTIALLPWVLKPVLGITSDMFPIFWSQQSTIRDPGDPYRLPSLCLHRFLPSLWCVWQLHNGHGHRLLLHRPSDLHLRSSPRGSSCGTNPKVSEERAQSHGLHDRRTNRWRSLGDWYHWMGLGILGASRPLPPGVAFDVVGICSCCWQLAWWVRVPWTGSITTEKSILYSQEPARWWWNSLLGGCSGSWIPGHSASSLQHWQRSCQSLHGSSLCRLVPA